jgi:peptidoglycan DL-endopeptidase CwlO
MKPLALLLLTACGAFSQDELRPVIERHLGRPYVWGAAGVKSFDCSGFVWRVWHDSGLLVKRTTARKLYMSMPKLAGPEGQSSLGTLVFFNNLKHVGIVNDSGTFYHAESSRGTNLSKLNSYWRSRVAGYRAMPQ